MNVMKFSVASIAILGALAASPAVHAHASLNAGGTGANPAWSNGAIADWMPNTVTLPSIGYLGIHANNSGRVIQTGVYDAAVNVPNNSTGLGGAQFAGVDARHGDSLLGQVYKYNNNVNNLTDLPTNVDISVGANSWAGGVSDTNTGLSWGNIHASNGTGNPEANLIALGANFLNVTVGDDISNATDLLLGHQKLAFSIYQGWATGPGRQGLNLLGTVLAASAGDDIGLSIALSGQTLNGAGTQGEYTIVVGDQSGVGGRYKLALAASSTALYSNVVTAVPVPGAIWLFGSAMAGLIGFGRRKSAVAA